MKSVSLTGDPLLSSVRHALKDSQPGNGWQIMVFLHSLNDNGFKSPGPESERGRSEKDILMCGAGISIEPE